MIQRSGETKGNLPWYLWLLHYCKLSITKWLVQWLRTQEYWSTSLQYRCSISRLIHCTVTLMVMRLPFVQWALWCCCCDTSVLAALLKLSSVTVLTTVQSISLKLWCMQLYSKYLEDVAKYKCICQSISWWLFQKCNFLWVAQRQQDLTLPPQLPNIYLYHKVGPVNKHATHPVKTLSKYIGKFASTIWKNLLMVPASITIINGMSCSKAV